MARSRNIKPAIMDNEELADMAPLTRLLFIYLWMLADREGRLEDRPKRIAAQALPYDRSADVDAMLDELASTGFIKRYQVNSDKFIQIVNFVKHQNPHGTEKDSEIPDENGVTTVYERTKNGYAKEAKHIDNSGLTVKKQNDNSLIPDSLIPDSLIPDSVREAPAAGAARPPKRRRAEKTTLPEGFGLSDRVRAWAEAKGFGRLEEHLEAFRRKATAHGYAYVNWDDAFMEAVREDWAKLRPRGASAEQAGVGSFV